MSTRNKILLLDDEEDLLDLYREVLTQLPSQPEIQTSNSGARAIALLEAEPFTMLISDLNMPKMDGLQVLSIVRRKYPQLRIVVMTSVVDEQYRSRAYAMGVDLFWEKPGTAQEIKLFQECIESLLGREGQQPGGFRGVQSKSLVDIIQLECLSQSSSVLKITNAGREGKIWVQNGELIDAMTNTLSGEAAFKEIFGWKTGSFEILPPEPNRTRTIFNSYQGLLLDSAQAFDESKGRPDANSPSDGENPPAVSRLLALSRIDGVEFLLAVPGEASEPVDSWGLENAEPMAAWARHSQKRLRQLGEKLQAGELTQLEGFSLQRHVAIAARGTTDVCVGFKRTLSAEQVRETMKSILIKWAS